MDAKFYGCSHGILFKDKCTECEIIWLETMASTYKDMLNRTEAKLKELNHENESPSSAPTAR